MKKDVVDETIKLLEGGLSKFNGYEAKLRYGTYEEFEEYNKECDEGIHDKFDKFLLENVKYFIDNIRSGYKYVTAEPQIEGDWYKLQIVEFKQKYSVNCVYVEPNKKLWRIFSYASEFYDPNSVPDLNIS